MRYVPQRRGIVTVWMAVVGLAILLLLAIASDTAYVYLAGHQLQNAADAAALAGVRELKYSTATAVQKAVDIAAANKAGGLPVQLAANAGNSDGGDVVYGHYTRGATNPFVAGAAPYNAMKIKARRTSDSPAGALNLVFGPGFGFATANVTRGAIAMSRQQFGAGIIALDLHRPSTFGAGGNPTITIRHPGVADGGIQVNSDDARAANITGNTTINATEMRVMGGVKVTNNAGLPDTISTGEPPVPDPLAGLAVPPFGTEQTAIKLNSNNTVNAVPGFYPGGITMSNGTLNCAPGIYVLGPPGLNITGGNLNAQGCMFYLAKGNGNNYASLKLTGNGTINISPPTSGPYAGITFFQDRTTPFNNNTTSTIIGTSTMNVQGTLYFPTTELKISGTSNNLANQIIADVVTISGNGSLTVNYDGRNPVSTNDIFLVK